MTNEYKSNKVSPPGHTIIDLLRKREWPIAYLFDELGLSMRYTINLLDGVLPVDRVIAERLFDIFGQTPEFWLERERLYRESIK
jgi:plasmid maintenance system antidote protein VapI